MRLIHLKSVLTGSLLFFLITGFLIACQSNPLTFEGDQVEEKNRVMLQEGGPHSNVWDTENVLVSYDYTRSGTQLDISGAIELRGGAANFHYVNKFSLTLYFLTPGGEIIESETIFSAGRTGRTENWEFDRTLEMPPGTGALAFGYSGEVRGTGRDTAPWSFWETPI